MSKEHTGPTFASSAIAAMIGAILGLIVGRARRHTSDAADPAAQPSGPARMPVAGSTNPDFQPDSPAPLVAPRIRTRMPDTNMGHAGITRSARRGLKLPWRADQVVRGSIWALSMFVIVVSVLVSLSRPSPTQLTTSAQSLFYDLTPIPTQGVAGVLIEAVPQDPSQAVQYTLAYRADALGAWHPASLYPESSSDLEDESVRIMLRIENTVPGGTYTINVRHDCAHEPLESNDGGGAGPDFYVEGPDSSIADAVLTQDGGTFNLWGGSFASADVSPADVNLCLPEEVDNGTDVYAIALAARAEVLYVIWDARLASPSD